MIYLAGRCEVPAILREGPMKLLGIFTLLTGFFIVSTSHAGFYVEPGVFYEKGDNQLDWPTPFSNSTGDTKGVGANIKMGFHSASAFFAGLEASYSNPKFTHSANNYDANATSSLYGGVIGAQMPLVGLRLWGGYVFGGELNPEESGGLDVKFRDARGPKVGVGFQVLMVSLNVEYMDLEYQNTEIEKAGPFGQATLDNKLKNKVGVVSVSLPLTL